MPRTNPRTLILGAVLAVAALVSTGCGGDDRDPAAGSEDPQVEQFCTDFGALMKAGTDDKATVESLQSALDVVSRAPEGVRDDLRAILAVAGGESGDPATQEAVQRVGDFLSGTCHLDLTGTMFDAAAPPATGGGEVEVPVPGDLASRISNHLDEAHPTASWRAGVERPEVGEVAQNVVVRVRDSAATAPNPTEICEAVSMYVFGPDVPAGAIDRVTVVDADDQFLAQRRAAAPACRTSGFTYDYVSDYLDANFGDAPWIESVTGGGFQAGEDGRTSTVTVAAGTPVEVAVEICRAAAPYEFGPDSRSADTSQLTVEAEGGTALVQSTSAEGCAAV